MVDIGDDSVTEPDSDEELSSFPSQIIEHGRADDSDVLLPLKQSHYLRPDFKSIPSQPPVGPFLLDQSRGIQVNASINRWLRDYQREGVQFFYDRFKEGRGGILGDDMGLGKTIQVIAFLSAIMKKTGDIRDENRRQEHVAELQDSAEWRRNRRLPPSNATWPTCLIIVPATVVHNWQRELETWGYFEVGIYVGGPKQRAPVLRDFELGRLDIVIISFALALKDIDLLESLPWSCVFVDEAHKVKNANSQTRLAFNRFDCQARFGLTGTAIQNNYTEFWNILDWSSPGRLGTLAQWNGWVTKPLTRGQDSNATPEELATGRVWLLTRLLPQFFMRRYVHLPKKLDQVVFCPLTEMQKRVYKRFLETNEVQTMLKKDDLCDCGSGKLGKECCYKVWEKSWTFTYISILLKISNHLALILPAPIDTPEQTQRHREQANIGWPPENGKPTAPSYGTAVFDSRLCGKWKVCRALLYVLKDLLTAWDKEGKGNKVLIFTKSVKLLDMLEHRLKESFMEYRRLDGSVKQADRMALVDEFNEDPSVFVFLISIMAGGVGLNLVAANKVVIFDPSWNPANDLQAQDRAFRFGQRRDVSVYRFLGAGSLEELIYKRQIYKQQQMKIGYEASHQTRYFEGVQGDKTKQGELWGIKNVFTLDEAGTATKHTVSFSCSDVRKWNVQGARQIERSHLAQLDWALMNLEGKYSNKAKKNDKSDISEVCDVKGLTALLLGTGKSYRAFLYQLIGDEALPRVPQSDETEIHFILNSNGVNYTHHNDSLLKASTIETKLAKRAIENKKRIANDIKKGRKGKVTKETPQSAEWPPKRKHHKPRKAHLEDRMGALITLGYIDAPGDLSRFAEEFVRKPEEEQALLLGELDEETLKMETTIET
ncbi:hypothetical protein K439DRAFT_1644098 [Ramaria rubella]|nr:hypothetical protein K439DRAFT_1644098 [Ramaria rubella]